MTAVFLRYAVVVALGLAGCVSKNSAEEEACEHVDGSYRSEAIDLSKLIHVPADKGVKTAASLIPRCYLKHPVGPYKSYVVRLGVFAEKGKTYIAYRIAGTTNKVLLFRVNENGDILDATSTTLPYMTEVNVR